MTSRFNASFVTSEKLQRLDTYTLQVTKLRPRDVTLNGTDAYLNIVMANNLYQVHVIRLQKWYLENQRPLPWRTTQDPYKIWISEAMSQQTTVTAVIPYYHHFLEHYPTLQSLAEAQEGDVLKLWSGLGYYSRARALHRAAVELAKQKQFPQTYNELLQYPGFGPYTARAVSSLAFQEPVGVLDGNSIRVLSRLFNLSIEWWKPHGRQKLQDIADQLAEATTRPDLTNQAMMELGATLCSPIKKPSCALCPLQDFCLAFQHSTAQALPLKKERKTSEYWVWEIKLTESNKKDLLLQRNSELPFLKGYLVPPGKGRRVKKRPTNFQLKGTVTHHQIFVRIERVPRQKAHTTKGVWVKRADIPELIPSSFLKKILDWSL